MVARYRIAHTSRYDYDRSVAASFNEARMTPLQTPWQIRLESNVTVDPVSWHYRYTDYWGNDVRVFEANGSHRSLEVRGTSLVEVDASRRPAPVGDLEWTDVHDAAVADEYVEFLTQTPFTDPPLELLDLAESIAADNPPQQTVALISSAVHDALEYVSGATEVTTKAAEAWEQKRGVCQDYTHLLVGALRHVGMPARYVSGYLHPSDEPQVGESAIGESHAWAEAWLGDWAAMDPTNGGRVGERHVMVGTGRDYGDVPPIKGIVAGAHNTVGLTVTVEVSRLA